jgi:folate-binding protein YgfZ
MSLAPGVIDRSGRGLVEVRGPDRVSFLQAMLSNDVAALRPGRGCRALLLTVKGKLVADLAVYLREDDVVLETDEGRGEPLARGLDQHVVMEDVEIRDRTAELGVLAVLGPGAFEAAGVAPLQPHQHRTVGDTIAAGVAYTGATGLHLIAPRPRIADLAAAVQGAGAAPLSTEAMEAMRIQAGWARWGSELDEDTIPLEAGLYDALSFTKGCYAGQEVIARVTARGHVNRRLVGLLVEGVAPPPPGTLLSGEGRAEAARVTSSCRGAKVGRAIALAYAFRTHADAGTELRLPDGRAARVVALPFSPGG